MRYINIKYFLVSFMVIIFVSGCDLGKNYLDRKPIGQLSENDVFTRYDDVNELVNDLYTKAKLANRPLVYFDDFAVASATDAEEATHVEENQTNVINQESYSPSGTPLTGRGSSRASIYTAIREANKILTGVKKYDTPDNPLHAGDLNRRIGEVYFLRGYLYWLLIRNWGAAVYLTKPVKPTEMMNFKRESVQTIVKDIVADADSAMARVPARWTGKNFGRVDQGACLGLIAVARFWAASPLWNGGDYPLRSKMPFADDYTYKQTRWVKAKKAAKAVIDFKVNGQKRYTLYTNFDNTDFDNDLGINGNDSKVYKRLWKKFYDMDYWENESVFQVTRDKGSAWQGDVYPPSLGGSARQQPTQEQVDEYGCISSDGYGYPVWTKQAKEAGYNDENPYTSCKRDPRFYADILYMGAEFHSETINTATGADKVGASNATTTGYYLRKFLKGGWNHNYSFPITAPAIWTLPQFIYMYAEAVNRLQGPTMEIYDMINKVRKASFMAPLPPSVLQSKEKMKLAIRRERRVELFHTNHYFWYLRIELIPTSKRVKSRAQAPSSESWPYPQTQRAIHGMKPVNDSNGSLGVDGVHYRMQRFLVEKRVFQPRDYLFPILQSDLQRDPNLFQNPGW